MRRQGRAPRRGFPRTSTACADDIRRSGGADDRHTIKPRFSGHFVVFRILGDGEKPCPTHQHANTIFQRPRKATVSRFLLIAMRAPDRSNSIAELRFAFHLCPDRRRQKNKYEKNNLSHSEQPLMRCQTSLRSPEPLKRRKADLFYRVKAT